MHRPRLAPKADRKYERFLLDIRIIVKTKDATFHGRTKNLAEGGMGATVAGEIALHEIVTLQFDLPGTTQPVVLSAEVRYRQGFQYGFKFESAAAEQLQIIRNRITNLDPEN